MITNTINTAAPMRAREDYAGLISANAPSLTSLQSLPTEGSVLDDPKMSRPETNKIDQADAALKRAILLVGDYDKKVSISLAQTKKEHLSALNALHEVCVALSDEDVRNEWFDREEIPVHGNLKNPYQPVVRAILNRAASAEIRKRATRYAGAIAVAIDRKIGVGEFATLIEQTEGGIEELYKTWRLAQGTQSRTVEAKKEAADLITAFVGEFGEIDIEPSLATEGHQGLTIAAVEFNEGRIVHLRVLISDETKVRQMIERHARAASSEMGAGQ